jgi:hypothetical protein
MAGARGATSRKWLPASDVAARLEVASLSRDGTTGPASVVRFVVATPNSAGSATHKR